MSKQIKKTKEELLRDINELTNHLKLVEKCIDYRPGNPFAMKWFFNDNTCSALLNEKDSVRHLKNKAKLASDFLKMIKSHKASLEKQLKKLL